MSKQLSLGVFVALVALMVVVIAGCQPADPVANKESGAKKVATFEGGEVTLGELQDFAEQSGAGELEPGSPQFEQAVQTLMPQLVEIEIAKAYAQEQNITVSSEDVDREIEAIKRPDRRAGPVPGAGREPG